MHLRTLFRALPLLTALLPLTTAQIPPSWSTNFTPSTLKLEATYSTNIRLTSGSRGGSLFPSEASSPPRFRLSDDSQLAPGARYTILLLDPDSPAPAGTGDSAYLHFLGTDYSLHSGADDARQLLPEGGPRVEYQGPKMADGGHRYVALLYVQRDGAEPEVGEVAREGFSLEGFERESGIGEAVAGLYFQTAKSDGEGRRRRDEVDDRVAGVGGAPVRRRDRRRRATVEGRDGAWEKEVAGLGPRGEKRGVIGDVNEAWRKRVTRLGPRNEKRDELDEELDEAWKKTASGLGPRNEKRASGLLERMKEIVKNTRPHLGPRNEKRDELFEELDEAWKKTAAGLGPRNEKRASGLLEKMKEIVKNTRPRLGPRNEKRDELFEELDEAWEKTIAGLGPRNQKRANGLHEKLKELAKKLGQRPGPRTQKRDELFEELDEAWEKTIAGLGPRNEKRDKGLLQRLKESIMKGPRRQKRDRPRQKPRKTAGRGPRNAARNGTAVSWTRGGGRRSRRPGRGA